MALNLSVAALLEKNKLSSDGSYIILLEIIIPSGMYGATQEVTLRVCRNNENITWGGYEWVAYPFEVDEIGETSKGEVPRFVLRISNIGKIVQRHVENAGGGIGSIVTLHVVHSKHLNEGSLLPPMVFETTTCDCTPQWVQFSLGADNPYSRRFPLNRFIGMHCRFLFKDSRCKYSGTEKSCDYSYTTCKNKMNNIINFGGFPAMVIGGVYA